MSGPPDLDPAIAALATDLDTNLEPELERTANLPCAACGLRLTLAWRESPDAPGGRPRRPGGRVIRGAGRLMSRARSTVAHLASYGTSCATLTTEAVIDGRSVRVTSGIHGGHDWCAIGQLGFAHDGSRVRVALLLMPAVTPAVLAGRARRPAYGDAAHAATIRHRAIWDLRQSGVVTAEISRRLGVHVEMVRRILQRYRRYLAQVGPVETTRPAQAGGRVGMGDVGCTLSS